MQKFIFNHTSFETAYRVENYPYGRLRTSMFYWIETTPKKGDRFCSRTIDPKNGRLNAPKKSTYSNIMVMYLDEKGHVHSTGVGIYTDRAKLDAFIEKVGIQNLNPEQVKQLKQLRGEKIVEKDPITGDPKKDFKVKWEKNHMGTNLHEVRITFDRPDRVQVKEIFEALRTLNQEKLLKMFDGYESNGRHIEGFARICTRGGMMLTTVRKGDYLEYLASDHANNKA
jgi:hypothetical protein